ncbi:MAG: amidohydrolase family protein [Leptolyngbyaceae cyanobacterium bins.349]|nr:amidohydrolase family protein [Leptolyngbyaceae cyanobacterium bins.349]
MATIFKNAHLLDPMQGVEGRGDVLIENGKIVGILQDDLAIGKIVPILVPQWDTQVIDLNGAFLSPGWIDLNTHVFNTMGDFCLAADDVGIRSGVTTIADAGTSGILTFDAFRHTAIDGSKTRVFAFMDPSLLYIATSDAIAHQLDLVGHPRNQNVERAAAIVEANRDVVVGFNVRPVRRGGENSPVLGAARALADRFHLPLLVHLGQVAQEEVMSPAELLPQLRAGDIVTSGFQANTGLFDGNGQLIHAAREAMDRGVLLNVSQSGQDFSPDMAKAAIASGVLPHILSTDLNRFNTDTAGGLATVMTRLINLGLSLSDVVERVTTRAAAAIGKSDILGGFKPGQLADFTIFKWVEQPSANGSGATTQTLKVCGVCRSGEYFHIERSPFDAEPIVAESVEPAMV